jgi:thiol-disulfide isomerase/thioredoxin
MKNVFTLLIVLLVACKTDTKTETAKSDKAVVESPATDIKLTVFDYNGLEPYLNKTDNKTHVVNFWATWCAPCVKELPFFEKLNASYANRNVEVILVSLDFPKQYDSKLKPFIKNKKLKSKVVALNDMDTNSWIPKISEDWTGAIPATLIYNKDKRQFYEHTFNYEELETQVKQFLN